MYEIGTETEKWLKERQSRRKDGGGRNSWKNKSKIKKSISVTSFGGTGAKKRKWERLRRGITSENLHLYFRKLRSWTYWNIQMASAQGQHIHRPNTVCLKFPCRNKSQGVKYSYLLPNDLWRMWREIMMRRRGNKVIKFGHFLTLKFALLFCVVFRCHPCMHSAQVRGESVHPSVHPPLWSRARYQQVLARLPWYLLGVPMIPRVILVTPWYLL